MRESGQGISTGRLEAFSDGVIAIAATLLILEVHKPEHDESVWTWLSRDWMEIEAYLIAFVTIGIIWVNHHMLVQAIRQVDRTLLFLNLGLLAVVGFLPLPTAVAGERPDDSGSIVLFSLMFGLAGCWFIVIWWYLHRHQALLEPHAQGTTGAALRRTLIGPLAYAVAALVAWPAPEVALVLNALIAGYFVIPSPRPPRSAGRGR